jgi:hypothetical protein
MESKDEYEFFQPSTHPHLFDDPHYYVRSRRRHN